MTNKLSWKPQLVPFTAIVFQTCFAHNYCTAMYMYVHGTYLTPCMCSASVGSTSTLYVQCTTNYLSGQSNTCQRVQYTQLCEVTCAIIVVSTVKCFNIGEFTVHYYIVFHYALLGIGAVFPELHGLVPCCLGIASCLLVCPLATIPSCQVQSCCCNKQIDL